MKKEIQLRDLGFLDYQTVWDLQHDLFQQTIDTKIYNRRNQTTNGNPPNIALWPQPGTVRAQAEAGNLIPLADLGVDLEEMMIQF